MGKYYKSLRSTLKLSRYKKTKQNKKCFCLQGSTTVRSPALNWASQVRRKWRQAIAVVLYCWLLTLQALSPSVRLTAELTQCAAGDEENRRAVAGPKRLKIATVFRKWSPQQWCHRQENCSLVFCFVFFQLRLTLHEINGRLVVWSLAGRFIYFLPFMVTALFFIIRFWAIAKTGLLMFCFVIVFFLLFFWEGLGGYLDTKQYYIFFVIERFENTPRVNEWMCLQFLSSSPLWWTDSVTPHCIILVMDVFPFDDTFLIREYSYEAFCMPNTPIP